MGSSSASETSYSMVMRSGGRLSVIMSFACTETGGFGICDVADV